MGRATIAKREESRKSYVPPSSFDKIFVLYADEIQFNGQDRTIAIPITDNITLEDALSVVTTAFPVLCGNCFLQTTSQRPDYEIHTDELFQHILTEHRTNTLELTLRAVKLGNPLSIDTSLTKVKSQPDMKSKVGSPERNAEQEKEPVNSRAGMPDHFRPLLSSSTQTLTVSHLEDQLSAYRISWGSWKHELGNKTIEDLFDEVRHGVCDLFADAQGVIRMVRLVRVRIVHPDSGMVLVNAFKMVDGKQDYNKVYNLPAYKSDCNEEPYHAALRNIQCQLGFAVWGRVTGLETGTEWDRPDSMQPFELPQAKVLCVSGYSRSQPGTLSPKLVSPQDAEHFPEQEMTPHILDVIKPVGFERPVYELLSSKSFPGLRTAYYINTLVLELKSANIPDSGSFTTFDQLKPNVTRLWQWMTPSEVSSKILKTRDPSVLQNTDGARNKTIVIPDNKYSSRARWDLKKKAMSYRKRIVAENYIPPVSLYSRFVEYWYGESYKQGDKLEQSDKNRMAHQLALPSKPELITEQLLTDWLHMHGVDTSRWGTGQAKHVHQLVSEVQKGEADLIIVDKEITDPETVTPPKGKKSSATSSGKHRSFTVTQPNTTKQVLRIIRVAKVEILHPHDPNLVLVETHQRLSDGRFRVRYKTLSEKFKPNETPWQAAIRGVREELFVPDMYTVDEKDLRHIRGKASIDEMTEQVQIVSMRSPIVETTPSPSYPGLETRYILHNFSCTAPNLPQVSFCTDEAEKGGGYVTHYWEWDTSANIKRMTDDLINQVRFYHRLVDYNNQDQKIIDDWLFAAAKCNHVGVIEVLCGYSGGASGGAEYAIGDSQESPTEQLIRAVDPCKVRDKYSNSPLRIACIHGSNEAVEILIRIQLRNARAKAQSEAQPQTDGILAINEIDIANQQDLFGCTLIYYAAIANRVELVKHLLGFKHVEVNSVCLHSCISRGAVDVLEILLPRLRVDATTGRRYLFGTESDPRLRYQDKSELVRHMVEPPQADSFHYFRSLLEHIDKELVNAPFLRTKGLEYHRESVEDEFGVYRRSVPLVVPLRALKIVLQFCNPMASWYKSYLRTFLHQVIEMDDTEDELVVFREFIANARYPLHVAAMSAHVLRSVIGLERRFWDSYNFHAINFQDIVCGILDRCEDQSEAEQLLRERADIPYWRRKDGTFVVRPYANRHKSTCAYLAIKYRLKKVVAHKFFTTQNDAIWFNDETDSLFTRGLGRLNHLSATLFQFDEDFSNSDSPGVNNHRKSCSESLISFALRIPGLKFTIQAFYRLTISVLLCAFLALVFPLLWVLPFNQALRVIVDIPRTEFACCYYKWSVWSISYVLYLVAFAILSTSNATSSSTTKGLLTPQEAVVFLFFLGNLVGLVEQVGAIGWGRFFQHTVNLVDAVSTSFVFVAFLVRLLNNERNQAVDICMSLGALISAIRLFHLFSASKELGPLWITMQYVVWDVARFLALLAVVIIAFILAFVFLLGGHNVTGFNTASETFSTLLWSVFEAFTTYDPNQTYQTKLYQLFLFFFLLVASVLLTNLLIAMMTDRYNAVQQTARVEWLFSLAQLIDKYSNMPILPPPLNLLVAIPNFYFRFRYQRQAMYDPDSNYIDQQLGMMETLPDLKRRYSMTRKATAVAPIGCEEDSKEPDAFTEGDKEELQALKFRATRRTVMARYISKCDEQEADKDAIRKALQRLNDTVDSCKELIMFNNPKVTSPASKVH